MSEEGFITDFQSIKTPALLFSPSYSGKIFDNIPIPSNSVHAEAIEYFSPI